MLIRGTVRDDQLHGTDASDAIHGFAGADYIFGSLGNDRIYAGSGDDTVTGLASGADRAWLGDGNDTVLAGFGFTEAHGGRGNDSIDAGTQGGLMFGDRGDDIASVGLGRAEGGTGNDQLYAGDYTRFGYALGHADVVGGMGADVFGFQACWNDAVQTTSVLDFRPEQGDHITLSAAYSDGTPLTDGVAITGRTVADWLDATHDGKIDEQDQAAGAAVFVDHATNSITLGVFTDNLTVDGHISLQTDWIV